MVVLPVCPAFPLRGLRSGPIGRVVGQAAVGGPVPARIRCQACSQGQPAGRCRVSRRAERASRAGTLISCARMVPVVALAWNAEARVPAARVRLNAIAAQTSQALFAANDPEGRCASGPVSYTHLTLPTKRIV